MFSGRDFYMEGRVSPLGHYKTNTRVFECRRGAKKICIIPFPPGGVVAAFLIIHPLGFWPMSVLAFFPIRLLCSKCDMAASQLGLIFANLPTCVFIFEFCNRSYIGNIIGVEFELCILCGKTARCSPSFTLSHSK